MVNSYATLLEDGTLAASGRSQSGNSRNRIDTGAAAAGCAAVKVYSNNLFDGDILSAEAAAAPYAAPQPPSPSKTPSISSQKFQQQRAMAAQKRLERLQLGGVAQSNVSAVAVVQVSSRPTTPGSTRTTGLAAAAVSSGIASPTAAQAGLGPGSLGRAVPRSSNSSFGDASLASSPGPWSGSGLRPSSAAERNLVAKGLATVYDPSEDAAAAAGSSSAADAAAQELGVVRPGNISAGVGAKLLQQGVPKARLDLSDMPAFLTRPGPKAGALLCFIERDKGGVGQSPCYRMHMDDGRTFLLAARKRKKAASSHYVISSSPQDLSRRSSSYYGKLKANFVGTEFSIQCKSSVLASAAAKGSLAVSSSAGGSSKRLGSGNSRDGRQTRDSLGSEGGAGAAEPLMQEVGAVTFGYNVLGTRGPRRMSVAVPAVHSADGCHRWRSSGPDDTLAERIKNGTAGEQVIVLHNKSPKWNDALNAYCLNFGGRVTEASVKNFQLFGKVSDSCFTCDFMWPLSPLQAFCICLASFDNKLACE
ncbi:tubby C-terminal-like domain-containing protein [Scenedesmus sp. NREL 46B-D3]|nr:tubby C-terminal-like domain-containing protein [Scenedesmus sp. NREL 46B-D3]